MNIKKYSFILLTLVYTHNVLSFQNAITEEPQNLAFDDVDGAAIEQGAGLEKVNINAQ